MLSFAIEIPYQPSTSGTTTLNHASHHITYKRLYKKRTPKTCLACVCALTGWLGWIRSASSSSRLASSSASLGPSASSCMGWWRRKEAKVASTDTLEG